MISNILERYIEKNETNMISNILESYNETNMISGHCREGGKTRNSLGDSSQPCKKLSNRFLHQHFHHHHYHQHHHEDQHPPPHHRHKHHHEDLHPHHQVVCGCLTMNLACLTPTLFFFRQNRWDLMLKTRPRGDFDKYFFF